MVPDEGEIRSEVGGNKFYGNGSLGSQCEVGRSVRIFGMMVSRELYAEEIAEEMKLGTLLWRQVYLP